MRKYQLARMFVVVILTVQVQAQLPTERRDALVPTAAMRKDALQTFDSRVEAFVIPHNLAPCQLEKSILSLQLKTGILIGFERSRECAGGDGPPSQTSSGSDTVNATVRELLDRLMGLVPGYRWEDQDGVAVIRPNAAWHDETDPLNATAGPFRFVDEDVTAVLRHLLSAPSSNPDSNGLLTRRIEVVFPGGRLFEALNAIARSHHDCGWYVGREVIGAYRQAFTSIQIVAADSSSFAVSVASAQHK